MKKKFQLYNIAKSKNPKMISITPNSYPPEMLEHCTPHYITIAQTLKTKFNLSAHENFQISQKCRCIRPLRKLNTSGALDALVRPLVRLYNKIYIIIPNEPLI